MCETPKAENNQNKQNSYDYTSPVRNLMPIAILQQSQDKDKSILSELSHDDEWAEVDKYRQLTYER